MGQKINPISFRLGINKIWQSRWYAEGKSYIDSLKEDIAVRKFLYKELAAAKIDSIILERPNDTKLVVTVRSAAPGIIIGRKGEGIEKLTTKLKKNFGKNISVNIVELKKPDLSAKLVAQNIAAQISNRGSHKRAMKKAIENTMRNGAKGIRVKCSGRLSGAEIARSEGFFEGTVALHTLRNDIDHAKVPAFTSYGVIGVQVWIAKGEILEHDPMASDNRMLSNY